ncbi:MAG: tRNA-dihydrouridine synthase family protein [Ruminococcaceae bacterium]|nr:tRNA-dihydrouridine synthase family protein [Oscillospiraceae bacterium]
MKLYFAPMEGITGYVFRNTHREYFGEYCEYFAPFINPTESEKRSLKELRDIMPEKNSGDIKVQILTNSSSHFLSTEEKVKHLGYNEININLGCPSNTVCKKGRGAGFLKDKEGLDRFLYEVFQKTSFEITIKTRLGFSHIDEIYELMDIYNKYPIKELIIHPRTREQFYNGLPETDIFEKALSVAKMPLCYNGNIYSKEDFGYITERFKGISSVMIGRGAIMNQGIFNEIISGEKITKEKLTEFLTILSDNYMEVLKSEHYTLGKMKEIMLYVMWMFPEDKKAIKSVKKANTLSALLDSLNYITEIQSPKNNWIN